MKTIARLVDGKAVDVEVALWGDVDAREALVVGDLQRGEGLVVVHVEQVDRQVQVGAKDEGHARRHQHPVVGQHARIICRTLRAGKGPHFTGAGLLGNSTSHSGGAKPILPTTYVPPETKSHL